MRTVVTAVALAILFGCSAEREPGRRDAVPTPSARSEKVVAQVGAHTITADMVARRRRQIDVYYPGRSSREAALGQLVHGFLALEILRREGIELDRGALTAERDRIERQTRDRSRLDQIKALFADDEDAFLTVGILPDFARSRLQRYYEGTSKFNESARTAAAALLDDLGNRGVDFSVRARQRGAHVSRLVADARRGLHARADKSGTNGPSESQAFPEGDREAAARLIALLADATPGTVHPRTLETPDGFHAVRLARRRNDGAIEVDVATFARLPFDTWFWTTARDIPIAVHDDALREAFIEQIGWARELTFVQPAP